MFNFLKSDKKLLELKFDSFQNVDIEKARKRTKIVVVDDDVNAFPFEGLKVNGYTVEHISKVGGNELQRLSKGEYDIIILDICGIADKDVSVSDGIGILERIKNNNPSQIVIAFSGQKHDINVHKFFEMADDYIQKPIPLVTAMEILDTLIKKVTPKYHYEALVNSLKEMGINDKQIKMIGKMIIKNQIDNTKITQIIHSADKALTITNMAFKVATLLKSTGII